MLVTSSIATAGRTATTTSPVTPSSRCSEPMLEVMINHRMRKLTVWPWGVGDPAVVQHLEQRTRTTSSGQEHAALAVPKADPCDAKGLLSELCPAPGGQAHLVRKRSRP
jgi:hypothetical protein